MAHILYLSQFRILFLNHLMVNNLKNKKTPSGLKLSCEGYSKQLFDEFFSKFCTPKKTSYKADNLFKYVKNFSWDMSRY